LSRGNSDKTTIITEKKTRESAKKKSPAIFFSFITWRGQLSRPVNFFSTEPRRTRWGIFVSQAGDYFRTHLLIILPTQHLSAFVSSSFLLFSKKRILLLSYQFINFLPNLDRPLLLLFLQLCNMTEKREEEEEDEKNMRAEERILCPLGRAGRDRERRKSQSSSFFPPLSLSHYSREPRD
jgi:hypothetical protein